jgi:hypothetical protein
MESARETGGLEMPASQLTTREHMVQIIEAQPEDSSFDEILRELALARMIDRGLEAPRPYRDPPATAEPVLVVQH